MVYTAKCVLVANRHILFTTIDRNLGVQHIVLFDRVNAGKSLLGASFRTSATQIPPFIQPQEQIHRSRLLLTILLILSPLTDSNSPLSTFTQFQRYGRDYFAASNHGKITN